MYIEQLLALGFFHAWALRFDTREWQGFRAYTQNYVPLEPLTKKMNLLKMSFDLYIYIPLNQYFIIDYSSSWPNVSLACHHVTSPGGENHRGRGAWGAWGAWPWASRREPESSGSYEPLFISCICTYLVNMWIDNLYKCGSVQYLMDFCRKKDIHVWMCLMYSTCGRLPLMVGSEEIPLALSTASWCIFFYIPPKGAQYGSWIRKCIWMIWM